MSWFIMISCGNGEIVPMRTLDGEVMLFDSEESAEIAAKGNSMAMAFGYTIYRWDEI